MSIEREAEKALEESRRKAVRERLFTNLERFVYQAEHVERKRGDDDWTCRLSASFEGSPVRGLYLTVKTPSALEFSRFYSWDLISFCPLWVNVTTREGSYGFSSNTKRVLGLDGNSNPD